MAGYATRTKSDNKHLSDLTGAKWVHIDGSDITLKTVSIVPKRLLRVVLNTNGATLTLRNGTEVIGIIALDAPETTYYYGIYCNDSIKYQAGGALDATLVFGD